MASADPVAAAGAAEAATTKEDGDAARSTVPAIQSNNREELMSQEIRVPYHLTIRELPLSERPRERLQHSGASALAPSELLAIILRTGVGGENVVDMAKRLLVTYGGLAGLARASFGQLAGEHGLGPAKTA
jgi:hypothetical protein